MVIDSKGQEQQCEYTNDYGSDFQDSVNMKGVQLLHNWVMSRAFDCLQEQFRPMLKKLFLRAGTECWIVVRSFLSNEQEGTQGHEKLLS